MAEELTVLFTQLRRDVVADLEQGLERRIEARFTALGDEMNSHFDSVYARFKGMEIEYDALKGGIKRLEELIEKRLGGVDVRSEIDQLKAKVADLQRRVADLEAEVDA